MSFLQNPSVRLRPQQPRLRLQLPRPPQRLKSKLLPKPLPQLPPKSPQPSPLMNATSRQNALFTVNTSDRAVVLHFFNALMEHHTRYSVLLIWSSTPFLTPVSGRISCVAKTRKTARMRLPLNRQLLNQPPLKRQRSNPAQVRIPPAKTLLNLSLIYLAILGQIPMVSTTF